MPVSLSSLLQRTIDEELPGLRALTDAEASLSIRNGWTRKQELGHLIDSATNNHARFVNIALQDGYRGPSYDQDGWVNIHAYAEMPWSKIVDFWHSYNSLLARLIARIPEGRMETICEIGKIGPITLRFLIEDYVLHLQHHIDQLLGRKIVSQCPSVQAAKQS